MVPITHERNICSKTRLHDATYVQTIIARHVMNSRPMERSKNASSDNKHLMTGHKGNSEFCFPETLNVPRGEAEGNIEVEGRQNSQFSEGPVIKCFVIPPDSKIEKATKKLFA